MSLPLIQQFHALAGEARFAEALALFADDASVVFHGPAGVPLAGRYEGPAEIGAFFGRIGSLFEIEQFEAQEFIDAGDTVVVLGRERSKVRATGRHFDVPWVQVWRTRGGRITGLTDFFDTGSMLPALTA
jgi:ketosteroid isomerase-like protein